MANISENMPKKVRHLNRKLKEVIRIVNALQNQTYTDNKGGTGKLLMSEKSSTMVVNHPQ